MPLMSPCLRMHWQSVQRLGTDAILVVCRTGRAGIAVVQGHAKRDTPDVVIPLLRWVHRPGTGAPLRRRRGCRRGDGQAGAAMGLSQGKPIHLPLPPTNQLVRLKMTLGFGGRSHRWGNPAAGTRSSLTRFRETHLDVADAHGCQSCHIENGVVSQSRRSLAGHNIVAIEKTLHMLGDGDPGGQEGVNGQGNPSSTPVTAHRWRGGGNTTWALKKRDPPKTQKKQIMYKILNKLHREVHFSSG